MGSELWGAHGCCSIGPVCPSPGQACRARGWRGSIDGAGQTRGSLDSLKQTTFTACVGGQGEATLQTGREPGLQNSCDKMLLQVIRKTQGLYEYLRIAKIKSVQCTYMKCYFMHLTYDDKNQIEYLQGS